MKIDVKEFFYSGNADQLCEDSGACFESENQLFNEVLKFLIENLYVSDPQVFEETFKVVIGTGMGLPESADVGDASFLNRVDKKILAPGFRRAVGMQHTGVIVTICFSSWIRLSAREKGLNS